MKKLQLSREVIRALSVSLEFVGGADTAQIIPTGVGSPPPRPGG